MLEKLQTQVVICYPSVHIITHMEHSFLTDGLCIILHIQLNYTICTAKHNISIKLKLTKDNWYSSSDGFLIVKHSLFTAIRDKGIRLIINVHHLNSSVKIKSETGYKQYWLHDQMFSSCNKARSKLKFVVSHSHFISVDHSPTQ